MSIQNISVNHKNINKYHEIIRLKTRKTKNYSDLYIFDKSYPYFHVSYHKDGNVFITPEDEEFKPYILYTNLKLDLNFESSFLHYFPTNINQYPIYKSKQKFAEWLVDSPNNYSDKEFKKTVFKFFIGHKDGNYKKGLKCNVNFKNGLMISEKNDNLETKEFNKRFGLKFDDNIISFHCELIKNLNFPFNNKRVMILSGYPMELNIIDIFKFKFKENCDIRIDNNKKIIIYNAINCKFNLKLLLY